MSQRKEAPNATLNFFSHTIILLLLSLYSNNFFENIIFFFFFLIFLFLFLFLLEGFQFSYPPYYMTFNGFFWALICWTLPPPDESQNLRQSTPQLVNRIFLMWAFRHFVAVHTAAGCWTRPVVQPNLAKWTQGPTILVQGFFVILYRSEHVRVFCSLKGEFSWKTPAMLKENSHGNRCKLLYLLAPFQCRLIFLLFIVYLQPKYIS